MAPLTYDHRVEHCQLLHPSTPFDSCYCHRHRQQFPTLDTDATSRALHALTSSSFVILNIREQISQTDKYLRETVLR